jgi:hypothetical protein
MCLLLSLSWITSNRALTHVGSVMYVKMKSLTLTRSLSLPPLHCPDVF